MRDPEYPKYIPPQGLEQLYFDFSTDKSLEWLNFAPKDWWRHLDAESSFDRYKEYVNANDSHESFAEWLANDGESRFLVWCFNSWNLTKRF